MTQWWILFCLFIVSGVGLAGYRYGHDSAEVACQKQQEAQQQATIAAQTGVIATIGKQQTITQGVENAHHSGIDVIDNMYVTPGVQQSAPATGGSMSPIPDSASRPDAAACQSSRTKYYKLTAKECDKNTDQLIDLQSWIKQQGTLY